MFFFGQDSDASTTTSLCGSRPSYTQKAEGRCDRRSSQSADQHCIKGYAFLDFLKFWKPEYSHFFCRVVCCMKWHLPPWRNGGGVETCVNLSLAEPTDMLFLYMFSVFPLFSLSTCIPGPACYGCVLCCRFIWYLPSPGCGSYELKNYR